MREIKYEEIGAEYIDHMGSDIRVANVAKVSFAKWDDEDVEISTGQIGLLNYLSTGLQKQDRDDWEKRAKASTHWTPYGHCFLSIRVAVPIFLARQLHKHVIGLVINEESRRYITDDVNLWLPKVVHKAPENAKQGASPELHTSMIDALYSDCMVTAKELIQGQTEQAVEVYYELIKQGVAPEESRMVLPLNSMTHWVWSGSLMAFLRVVKQRVDPHAQNAAQEFGNKLLPILKQHFPESVKAFGF
jgi:thymidylate synthase (FAD)